MKTGANFKTYTGNKNMKKKKKKHSKYTTNIARIVGIPIGALLGYWLTQTAISLFSRIFADMSPFTVTIIIASATVFFALVFFLFAPSILDFIVTIGYGIEKTLSRYSSKNIAAGIIGLFLGLLMAFLLSNLIQMIPIHSLAVFLTVIDYVLLGTLGMVLGIRKLKEIVIVNDKTDVCSEIVKLLDTSALIDGRIYKIAKTGFLEGKLMVPKFIIAELHAMADSADAAKRKKARRGLDLVAEMQQDEEINLVLTDYDFENESQADTKLMRLAGILKAELVTLDFNLAKVASVLEIPVLNINELITALRASVTIGDTLEIEIVKPGKDKTQGIGYTPEGTMVVVENAAAYLGQIVQITVTSNIQTNAGLMIFGKICSAGREPDKERFFKSEG